VTIERALELILGNLGVLILLLFILVGGFRGWWVYGRFYEEQARRIDRLERQLDRATGVAERGTVAADRATRLVERHTEVPGA
jgi:uncharacterized membrane protein YciS (DUF1049 family)